MQPGTSKERLRCRLIKESDFDSAAQLLHEGFSGRSRDAWKARLHKLESRIAPEGLPNYGYCLDTGTRLVGILLLIVSTRIVDGQEANFTNVSSWYVNPDYRAYAQLLVSVGLRNKHTTYTNISAAPHTWPIVEKQGYVRYCGGWFLACAALQPSKANVRVEPFGSQPDHYSMPDHILLKRHFEMGCRVLVCRERDELTGFVLRRYRIRSGRIPLPAMMVIHGPERAKLIRYAGSIGRYNLRSGAPFLVMDADGPVPGLAGYYTEARGRKYFKGPHRPALCDLSDSEFAVFGV